MIFKKFTLSFLLLILINLSANALELKVPKIGGKKADISGAKLNLLKYFLSLHLIIWRLNFIYLML